MSWDHTVTITSSGTWAFPSPPPRDYLVHVEGVGGGGGGGSGSVGSVYHPDEWGSVPVYHPTEYGWTQVWVPDQWGLVWRDGQMFYEITVPGHYESQYGVVRDSYTEYVWQIVTPAYYTYYNTSGGGGEAGAPGSADITLPDQSNISVTIGGGGGSNSGGGTTSFGSLFSLAGGSPGGAASGGTNGAGGSGGPGNNGSAGNNNSPGIGGSGTNGYGSGANGGTGNSGGGTGQSGYLTISWNDFSYAYVMEGE